VKWRVVALLAPLCIVTCRPAHAQTCTVSGTAVAFGTYAPFSGMGVTTTGTITVVCNPGLISLFITYTVTLSIGGGTSYALRSMGGATPRLKYQLYKDSADTQVWGDGSAGTFVVTDGYTLGLIFPITKMYTVYGVIAANTPYSVGSYTDPVVVTVTY
jgi:spore coat protein U-like protein